MVAAEHAATEQDDAAVEYAHSWRFFQRVELAAEVRHLAHVPPGDAGEDVARVVRVRLPPGSLVFKGNAMSLRLMACIVLGVACSACKDEPEGPCQEGLAVGDRYVIALKSVVPTTPVSACPTGFDLAGGTELTVTVSTLDEEVGECSSARAEVAPFDGWSWSPDPARATPEGGANFIGHYLARKGDCQGRVDLRVILGGTSCERGWTPGDSSVDCAAACYDLFDCEVKEAP
jgi:hypothetical protein